MPLQIGDKKSIVQEVNETASAASSMIVSDYRGITVSEVTDLRRLARHAGVSLKVIRNTLAKRAIAGTHHECLTSALVGPSLFAFSFDDPAAAARLLRDYHKTCPKIEVKAISLDGDLKSGEFLDVVASLPTKGEAIANLMSVVIGPATKLARTMKEVPAKLARAMAAVRDQKLQQASG